MLYILQVYPSFLMGFFFLFGLFIGFQAGRQVEAIKTRLYSATTK